MIAAVPINCPSVVTYTYLKVRPQLDRSVLLLNYGTGLVVDKLHYRIMAAGTVISMRGTIVKVLMSFYIIFQSLLFPMYQL